jgi:iron complex transport system permease protein
MNREGHRAGSVTPRRFAMLVTATCLGCVATMAVASLVGSTRIDPWRALGDRHSFDAQILFRARLPRVLFAAIVGAALAASGVVFQAILRNPLASPFTLGISGGASLGAVLAIRLGWEARAFGLSFLPVASLLGAFAVAAVVYALSVSQRRFSPVTLLLSGVILNFVCSAAILLVQYFSDFTQSFLILRWMMGGLDVYDYGVFINVGPFVLVGGTLLVYLSRYLNVLSAGDEWATSRGLDVRRLISLEYVGASLVTGSVVAYCGPIGFVGLIVPHALRLVVGADHRVLLPTALFVGAAFLVACDTIARTVLAPIELPVGVITAILGGPFFLWLLLGRKRDLGF